MNELYQDILKVL